MNKRNLPWSREWECLDLDIEKDNDSILMVFLYLLVFVALCMTVAVIFVEGIDRQARVDQAKAEGRKAGNIEMLQRVKQETEKEADVWLAYYRAASKPGMNGFDGLMLAESEPQLHKEARP